MGTTQPPLWTLIFSSFIFILIFNKCFYSIYYTPATLLSVFVNINWINLHSYLMRRAGLSLLYVWENWDPKRDWKCIKGHTHSEQQNQDSNARLCYFVLFSPVFFCAELNDINMPIISCVWNTCTAQALSLNILPESLFVP